MATWSPAARRRRAFSLIVRSPIVSNGCWTSNSSIGCSCGNTSCRSRRRAGMSHWRFPRSKIARPSVWSGDTWNVA